MKRHVHGPGANWARFRVSNSGRIFADMFRQIWASASAARGLNQTGKLLYLEALRGGPGQSPTADLRVRSALLYATELPGHVWLVYREDA
jgi:hypothetical protein